MKYVFANALCFGICCIVQAQTIVAPGEVSGIWEQGNSPYQITGNIHIPNDSTLIIEPGVTVEFQGHYELKVMGSLKAEGTQTDSILFTVNDTTGFFDSDTTLGGWYGIRIYDIDSQNDSTNLAFCRLEYGKAYGSGWFLNSGGALCVIDFDKVSVSNCLFINNKACGPNENFPAGGAVHLAWSDAKFTNNTFTNNSAHAGGAIQFHESNPVFKNNTFVNNSCVSDGGGLSSGGGSNPSFSGDLFSNNRSEEIGGGLSLWGSNQVTMDGVTISENIANWAGGIGFLGCEAVIKNSTISNNLANRMGGGISADGSTITIRNSTLENDSALSAAGGIHSWQGTLVLDGVSFIDNSSRAGGAINTDWSNVIINHSDFLTNSARGGGALHLFNSHLQMDSCLLDGNSALEDGGAIDYAVDTLVYDSLFVAKICNSQIVNNYAGRAAGGFSIQQTHSDHPMLNLSIDRCQISDNVAHHVGGFRILRCLKSLQFSNSIINGNKVEAWTGGGSISHESTGHVYNSLFYDNRSATVNPGYTTGGLGISHNAKVDVMHCTIAKNKAGRGGGLQVYRGGDAIVTNCIIWENLPDQIALSAVYDTLPCKLTINYNDIQYGFDSIHITDSVSFITFGEGNINSDPLFLDDTNADFHLMETSPAIGAAINTIEIEGVVYQIPPYDLEGNPRPEPSDSKPDMGAFEHKNAWPVGIENFSEESNVEFVATIYPNPFNQFIILEFLLPEKSDVSLEFFNLLGERIDLLVCKDLDKGKQSISWNPTMGNNNILFYRLRIKSISKQIFMKTGRLIRMEY